MLTNVAQLDHLSLNLDNYWEICIYMLRMIGKMGSGKMTFLYHSERYTVSYSANYYLIGNQNQKDRIMYISA